MDNTSFVKALLINAACTNAAAVCENTQGGGVPIDPLIQDTNLQGKGVMVYEEAKIQYAALLRAFQDKSGVWPDPQVSSTPTSIALPNVNQVASQLAPLASKLLPILSAVPALAPVVGPLTALLGVAQPKPTMPGADLPPTPAPAPAAKS
jgi:hypothetical protein